MSGMSYDNFKYSASLTGAISTSLVVVLNILIVFQVGFPFVFI